MNLNFLLLAVEDPLNSATLYDRLLGQQPVERSKTFVLYVLPDGIKLGLWANADMRPMPTAPGGFELSFACPDKAAVLAAYREWTTELGLAIVQEPTDMDFGFTFTAADGDGHRLRPFAPNQNPR